jgi:hypothetical protein
MTQIISLNKTRKANARANKAKKAAENRVKFGRTKAEKQVEKLKVEKAKSHLQAHKREKDDE